VRGTRTGACGTSRSKPDEPALAAVPQRGWDGWLLANPPDQRGLMSEALQKRPRASRIHDVAEGQQ